jgi:hypothetical protein
VCAACHAKEHALWSRSHHDLAIRELEFPRLGFNRLDAIDHVLVEARDRMQ